MVLIFIRRIFFCFNDLAGQRCHRRQEPVLQTLRGAWRRGKNFTKMWQNMVKFGKTRLNVATCGKTW